MRNNFFIFFLGILLIVNPVLAKKESESTTTEPLIGTTTEPLIGTTTEPLIGAINEPVIFKIGNGISILGGGSTIFEDNFNAYNDGDLNGQGNWAGGTDIDVQGVTVKEGEKAVQGVGAAAGGSGMKKAGSAIADGQIIVYMRRDSNSAAGTFAFMIGTNVYPAIRGHIKFKGSDSKIYYYSSDTPYALQAYNVNQWYEIKIEWRSSDGKVNYSVTGGSTSGWVAYDFESASPNSVILQCGSGTAGDNMYYDYIAENPYSPIPAEFNSTNTFFAYFFSFGDYILYIFAFVLVVVLVAGFLNFFLGLDRKKSIN